MHQDFKAWHPWHEQYVSNVYLPFVAGALGWGIEPITLSLADQRTADQAAEAGWFALDQVICCQ